MEFLRWIFFLPSAAAGGISGLGIGIVLNKGRQVIRFAIPGMHHRANQW